MLKSDRQRLRPTRAGSTGVFRSRAEIALRFQTSACNSRAAAFVLSTLLKTDYPYFPALRDDTETPLFSMHAAELAVIEIQITEQMLTRWTLIHPTPESACQAATDHLWRRLAQIRDKARAWVAAHESGAQAPCATSASMASMSDVGAVSPSRARELAVGNGFGGMGRLSAAGAQVEGAQPTPELVAQAVRGGPMPLREGARDGARDSARDGARDGWREALRDRPRPRRRSDILILRPDRHSNIG